MDATLLEKVREWLPYEGSIWIDDKADAVAEGIVSKEAITRLATAPSHRKANRRWRVTVGIVIGVLTMLAIGLAMSAFSLFYTNKELDATNKQLNTSVREQTALRLNVEAQTIVSGARSGGTVLGFSKLLAAHRIAHHSEIEATMWGIVLELQRVQKIIETNSAVTAVAINPDGTKVVSGSEDKTLRLWDVQTGRQIGAPMKGHEGKVWSVAFSPEGTKVVSGSDDNTLRLWDVETRQPIGAPFIGHKHGVRGVAFSPDGTKVVSGSPSGMSRRGGKSECRSQGTNIG